MDRHPGDLDEQLRLAYQRTVSRRPTPPELARAVKFVQAASGYLKEQHEDALARHKLAVASFVQTLFGSAEFRYLIHAPAQDTSILQASTKAVTQ
jgi:hypothetical protein